MFNGKGDNLVVKLSKRPAMSERALMEYVIDLCKLAKWTFFHDHDSRRNPAGLPDLIMVKDGRIIFAELKTEKNKLSEAQNKWLAELQRCKNIEVYVWRPSDIPAIERTLLGRLRRR